MEHKSKEHKPKNRNLTETANPAGRRLELLKSISAAQRSEARMQESKLIGDPDFPGRLEHREISRYMPHTATALELRYEVYAAPCMDDFPVEMPRQEREAIEIRIMCGDIWIWCTVTVQVQAISGAGLRGVLSRQIGQSESVQCSYNGLEDYLARDNAYSTMKMYALKDLGVKVEAETKRVEQSTHMVILGGIEVGKVIN